MSGENDWQIEALEDRIHDLESEIWDLREAVISLLKLRRGESLEIEGDDDYQDWLLAKHIDTLEKQR